MIEIERPKIECVERPDKRLLEVVLVAALKCTSRIRDLRRLLYTPRLRKHRLCPVQHLRDIHRAKGHRPHPVERFLQI